MVDNVPLTQGPLVVATKGDQANVQHQKVVNEFLSPGGEPIAVASTSPQPIEDVPGSVILTAILIEMRVMNEMLYALMNTECEPLELLRAKYADFPITL
jgi:multisubunit Na+/H+ antiporter MnhC subunit